MRRLFAAAAALLLASAACGDNLNPEQPPPPKDAPSPDAAPDGPAAVAPCLDHPTNLPQPGGRLPCELIPPSAAFQQP
jgi:hypothetical protein